MTKKSKHVKNTEKKDSRVKRMENSVSKKMQNSLDSRVSSNKSIKKKNYNAVNGHKTDNLVERSLELSTWASQESSYIEKDTKSKKIVSDVTVEDELSLRRTIFDEIDEIVGDGAKQNSKKQPLDKDVSMRRRKVFLSSQHKKRLLIDGIFLLVAIFIFSFLVSITPKIYILGEDYLKIDYGTTYSDLGASAKYLNKDYTDQIKVEGKVDTSKVGTYTILYTLKFSSFRLEKKRVVEVVDRKAPSLELIGDSQTKICPNGNYQDEGARAVDEYDGDLTDQIVVKKEKGKIIYSVKDSSLNETKVVRELLEIDEEAPVIQLKGSQTIYVDYKGKYKEPGYEAIDNCDGDLTNQVSISGSVNVNKLGTYKLTYAVTDTSGKKAEVQRTVIVSNRTDPESGTLKTGAIYLTFDDGPNAGTTDRILDILKEEGVKATFFVTCNGPDSLLKREYEEGHSIALHTASHNYAYLYKSEENYFADLKKVFDRVRDVTGYETKLIRFPGGSSNTVSKHYNQGIMTRLTKEVLERGYRYYDWNVDASDAWQCAKQNVGDKSTCVYNNVTRNLSKSRANVVLMHDVKEHTVQALRNIIRYGKENGYTFEVIDTGTKMVMFKVNN